jgi:two-component system, NarL family, sensor histidine kinase DegS
MSNTGDFIEQLWKNIAVTLFRNVHFWIIIALITAITFIYYYALFPYTQREHFLDPLAFFESYYRLNGLLYTIPLLYAAIIFPWYGTLILWAILVILAMPRILTMSLSTGALLTNMLFSLIPMILIISIQMELSRRKRELAMRGQRERERQAYMKQIFKATDEERRRISQELHDDTIQTLLVVATYASSLDSSGEELVRENSKLIKHTLLQVVEDLRRLTLDLSPSILDNLGLLPALRWSMDHLRKEDSLEVDVVVQGSPRRIKSDLEINVFRIIQEAINNVRKHSGASKVMLALEYDEKSIQITLMDNGKGFELPENLNTYSLDAKMGLLGMRQRANFIGGILTIDSKPGEGTKISFSLMDKQNFY